MIEGLKVTVDGDELVELCRTRSQWHSDRAELYKNQAASMRDNQLEGMQNTSVGNPMDQLIEKARTHENEAYEMMFIADHIADWESYQLGRDDLQKLGISKARY